VDHVRAGLLAAVSPEQQARIDVVSDILAQAQRLLDDSKTHPAAAAVLIGASLEEFLRTRADARGVTVGTARPGVDAYAKALLQDGDLAKQDIKDITAWAGIRNHAAHGEWASVGDSARVRLMLEGVNLFMRQVGARTA
jgi:hypothetical protein